MNTEQKDDMLWQIAKKRAAFKSQLISYVLVNSFLVVIWFISSGNNYHFKHFWPIWPIVGWGIGLAFSYFSAYHNSSWMSAEKEYEKLKNKQQ